MQVEIDEYRMLLLKASQLYERHEAGRREPFNVFTVLRTAHDEVNLHSRFLHALLNHRQAPGAKRKNLAGFIRSVYKNENAPDICSDEAAVERERNNVDILIRDERSNQAVVIENKIWAADQHRQLQRYAERLEEKYATWLLYLTLDGHEPEEHSQGNLDVKCISYRYDIRPWLARCQQRAYDEPELRESIAQYRHLIGMLTGSDSTEAYMDELRDLCLKDDNLVLIRQLNDAVIDARVSLLIDLVQEIENKLNERIADLPGKETERNNVIDPNISDPWPRRYIALGRNTRWRGLYYKFRHHAYLGVEFGESIFFGVKCLREQDNEGYSLLRKKLHGGEDDGDGWWPVPRNLQSDVNLRQAEPKDIKLLADKKKRDEYVDDLVSGVCKLWEEIKINNLVTMSA